MIYATYASSIVFSVILLVLAVFALLNSRGTAGRLWSRFSPPNEREPTHDTGLSVQTIVETVPTMLWTARPDGSVDFVSGLLYRYSGLSDVQVAGLALERRTAPR